MKQDTDASPTGVASKLEDGYSGNVNQGFVTFDQARKWMELQGFPDFHFHMPTIEGVSLEGRAPRSKEPGFYAVANGRVRGIYATHE